MTSRFAIIIGAILFGIIGFVIIKTVVVSSSQELITTTTTTTTMQTVITGYCAVRILRLGQSQDIANNADCFNDPLLNGDNAITSTGLWGGLATRIAFRQLYNPILQQPGSTRDWWSKALTSQHQVTNTITSTQLQSIWSPAERAIFNIGLPIIFAMIVLIITFMGIKINK